MWHRKCEQIRIFCKVVQMLFHSVGIQTTEKTFPFTFPRDEKTKSMEHCINEPEGTRRRRQQKICMMCVQVERKKCRNLLVLIKNVSQVTKNFFYQQHKIYLIITHGWMSSVDSQILQIDFRPWHSQRGESDKMLERKDSPADEQQKV